MGTCGRSEANYLPRSILSSNETRRRFDATADRIAADTRHQFELTAEAIKHEVQLTAESVIQVTQELRRETADIRDDMRRGFADTQAMINVVTSG